MRNPREAEFKEVAQKSENGSMNLNSIVHTTKEHIPYVQHSQKNVIVMPQKL